MINQTNQKSKKEPLQTDEETATPAVGSTVLLKHGRDKPVRQKHPWIFSGAIQQLPSEDDCADGSIVSVTNSKGKWLARGYLNRRSQIQVRLLSWDKNEEIDESFWRKRIRAAVEHRKLLNLHQTDSYRLIHAESDFLPGLTVDRYGDCLVMQLGTLALDQRKGQIAQILAEETGCTSVIERSEGSLRHQEGLSDASGVLFGAPPADPLQLTELGYTFRASLDDGQKSGYFLDQRENRQRVAAYCAGKRVLNAFSYTAGFAVHALAAGALSVHNIDRSISALKIGKENLSLNGFNPDSPEMAGRIESIAGDVFEILRDWRDFGLSSAVGAETALDAGVSNAKTENKDKSDIQNAPFDLIILDPPKFAHSKRHLDRALRGYKDINLLAMGLLKPGGILATFSCSGLVSADLFQKVVFGAAIDAGRSVQILEWLRQPADHPVAITFPEGAYLKGLICRVL